MKNVISNLILSLIIFSFFSCNKTKTETKSLSQFYTDSIYSNYLKEYRKHNIYLPENFNNQNKYAIIYATDGGRNIKNHPIKQILDSLINNKIIKPTIYVESHSNSKIADSATTGNGKVVYLNYRNFEYVENQYSESYSDSILAHRFKNHMSYFKNEFIPTTEKELALKLKKEDRIFYGYSNGAGFGVNFLNKNPETIGSFLCYSTLGSNIDSLTWNSTIKYPNLYLQYGNKEPNFFKEEAEKINAIYNSTNATKEFKVFNGGHKNIAWRKAFTENLSEILKPE